MSMAETRIEATDAMKADWLERLNTLISFVKGWVEDLGWRTRQVTKSVTEPGLGHYEVPLLLMEREEVEIILSPVARIVPGADGLVDLYLMPGYDDVASLYFEGGQWVIHDAFLPDPMASASVVETERPALDEVTIRRVLEAVSSHA